MISYKKVDPRKLWEPTSKKFLIYLLGDPIKNSAILIRSWFPSDLKRLFFGLDEEKKIQGCAFVDYSSLNANKIIMKGSPMFFEYFLPCLDLTNVIQFDYVDKSEMKFFNFYPSARSEISYLYYIKEEKTYFKDLNLINEIKLANFIELDENKIEQLRIFYNLPRVSKSNELLRKLNGLCLINKEKIIASIYDNLSIIENPSTYGLLGGIRVQKEWQNKGLCTHMTNCFSNQLMMNKRQEIGLFVHKDNIAAQKCYENAGFKCKKKLFRLLIE